jgi:hypothetical protein
VKGVSAVIETVLIAGATVIFLVYLMGALNDFTSRISGERIRNALSIDSQKVINAILLARKATQSGEAKFHIPLSDIQYEMYEEDGRLITKSRSVTLNTSIFSMDSYVTFTGHIINSKEKRPYITCSGDTVTMGTE